ncbi:PREDICTED: granulocyte-macrophage colony-stimulating factor receptor subunit alpha-like [Calidris pugnax]|uniref:granulocyte-macrophage colony-stimulating factor receptor subunit alpha-like n=1 Tax=Calidris pugnax TaxID=198806 RepID=UPI00071D82EE|nr:PREDICTED: granulocyte-macrophage colony-stimulating factor receptor subunit alpha-like [Calidris pugnax]
MFNTLGLICMIWWYMMLFHPLHADIQCTGPKAQESAIRNMKINWRTGELELSWNSSKNFITYKCTTEDKITEILPQEVNSSVCSFAKEQYILHKGVLCIIEVPNTNISKNFTFIPGGVNGSAIENFSCVIYNVSLMNCTWQAGREAPGDTQYFLYWQYSGPNDTKECELYIKDKNGRNIGCRFENVTTKPGSSYILVNGSSNVSQIQFYDTCIDLYEIEILAPPLNVTAKCTRDSSCIITWQQPLISYPRKGKCFEYEIGIQNKDEPKEGKKDPPIRNNTYIFQNYNKKKKYILKIRARGINCLLSSNWGEWSEPIEFGQPKDYFIFVILFLIAIGTISVMLIPYCLFKRYCSFKSIFSPIPQPKDKINASNDEDMQTGYINLKKSWTEEITVVEEMT